MFRDGKIKTNVLLKTFITLTLAILMFACSACTAEKQVPQNNAVETIADTDKPAPDEPAVEPERVTDDVLISLVLPIEIALGNDEFAFTAASDLTSQQLFTAFLALADESQMKTYQNPEDEFFYFTEDDITKCLNRYFKDFSFYITDVPNYDDAKQAVVMPIVSGFGGDRFMKITDKNVTGDTVVFTAAFFDDITMSGSAYMEKCYTIQFYDGGCYYLSATKQ